MHQGDVSIIMPTFYGDEHLGWCFANMHVLDVGGVGISGYAPGAHDVWQEGMRFPPIRIIKDGRIDPEWEHYIAANVRAPGAVLNDIRSMIASNNTANAKLDQIIGEFGLENHKQYCEINKDLTEQVLRERISRMPDGVYETVDWNEFDGHDGPDRLLELRLRLEVDGSDLRFFYTGVPQIDAFVNSTEGPMFGQAMTGLMTLMVYGDLPVNGGLWRPITVDIGEPGTIVNSHAAGAGVERALRGRHAGLQDGQGRALPGDVAERRPRAARARRGPAPGRVPGQRAVRRQPARRHLRRLLPGQRDRLGRRRPDDQRRPGRLRADVHDRRRHPGHREPRGRRPGAVPLAQAAAELRRPGPEPRRPVARAGLRRPLQRPDGRPGLQRVRAGAAARVRRRLPGQRGELLPDPRTRTWPS